MQIIEDEKITVEINGKATECDLLFTFTSDDTGKGYLGYTDNTFNADGRKNIYFSSYDPLFGTGKLEKVTDPNEIEMIKEVLEEIDGGVNNA